MMTQCNNYFEIDGTYYALDMDALSKYIVGVDNEKIIEKTKSEQWAATADNYNENEMMLVSKDITETSSSRKDEYAPFRAEIAKMMLTLVIYPTIDSNGETTVLKTPNDSMTFGQAISLNTLMSEGIIKEIILDDEED